MVDSLAGPQHEYKIVLGAACWSRCSHSWQRLVPQSGGYIAVALSSGTLAFFTDCQPFVVAAHSRVNF